MADLYPVAGMKIYIGGTKTTQTSDFVAGDFASESWTEVDGWETCGAFGDAAQVITTSLINRGRDLKQKGTKNAGSMQCNFAQIDGDSGQAKLLTASQSTSNYAFRVDGSETGGTPSKRYFVGLVMGFSEQGGSANSIRMIQANIEINSNIVRVAAS